MKKLAFLLVLSVVVVAIIASGCKKQAPPPPEQPVQKPVVKDTTPPPPPPPPPTPKATLQESQFQTVYFDFDKYNLRPDAKAALDADFKLLQDFPDAAVRIEGNCDERGTVEYNLALGEKRARAAMDYLVGLGIAANRLSIISYGKERPAVQGHDEAAWSKNRRDEFRIVSQ